MNKKRATDLSPKTDGVKGEMVKHKENKYMYIRENF